MRVIVHDYRLPRALHDRPEPTQGISRAADRGARRSQSRTRQGRSEDHRRSNPGEPRKCAIEAAARARLRRDDLLAAGRRHGPSYRQCDDERALDRTVQRPHPSRLHALSRQFHRRLPIAAIARRAAEELHSRARTLRHAVRFRRLQSQSRSGRRLLDRPAVDRPLVVSALREDGRARRAGDGPRHARRRIPPSTIPAPITSTATPPPSCSSCCRICSRISRR